MTEVCEAEWNWREIQRADCSTAGEQGKLVFVACTLQENLSNRSSGVQILHDICTHFGRYLYSTKYSWIIINFYWLLNYPIWPVQLQN